MAQDTSRFLATQANKTGDAVAQLGRKGVDFSTLPIFGQDVLEIGAHRIRERQRDLATGSGFVLGHPVYGVLGGSTGSAFIGDFFEPIVLAAIYNDNDYFPEGFWNDRFIDTDVSTGSHYLVEEQYSLLPGEILQSSIIAFENKLYKSAILSMNDTLETDTYLYLSATGSNNDFELVTNTTRFYFSAPTTEGIKYKISNDSGSTFPFTFPYTFGGATQIITGLSIKYFTT